MADACFMVHLVCLFLKTHLPALLQDNCLDLVLCVFLRKLFGCVRNITVFCWHLLLPVKSAVWPILIYRWNPNISPIYRSISISNGKTHPLIALKSCWNPQKAQQVCESTITKQIWFCFFVNDVVSNFYWKLC